MGLYFIKKKLEIRFFLRLIIFNGKIAKNIFKFSKIVYQCLVIETDICLLVNNKFYYIRKYFNHFLIFENNHFF